MCTFNNNKKRRVKIMIAKKKIDMSKRAPDFKDKIIGARIKAYRDIAGMSQSELGEAVGITFQQIQKYEHGTNKVSLGRLFEICDALNVSTEKFMQGLTDTENNPNARPFIVSDNSQIALQPDPMTSKETTELLRVYYSVTDPKKRKSIVKFIKDSFAE
jgi:transcriptional regulator with XRE-family HTH domain